ncbi:MAG: hypothetical protein ACE5D7_10535, partial [Fidelibacterota bacterium]
MQKIRSTLIFILFCISVAQNSVDISEIQGLNYSCNACHTNSGWTEIVLTGFHHDSTGFKLRDAHDGTECRACHLGETLLEVHQFRNASTQCIDCHLDIHDGQFGRICETCHSPSNWLTNRDGFRHELTNFPLTEGHIGVDCRRCHPSAQEGIYRGTSLFCSDCHQIENAQADLTIPDHSLFSDQCEICHHPNKWNIPSMDHSRTGYPLLGKHNAADCNLCHTDQYIGTNTECFTCHYEDYTQTSEPVHVQQIYPLTDCASCHTPSSWSKSVYDHQPEPDICSLCHLIDWFSANENVIGHFSLPNQCMSCHSTTNWNDFIFDHTITSFHLTGMHVTTDCTLCHENGFYLTPTACMDCHIEA